MDDRSMFKSHKFWIPFGVSLLVNALWVFRIGAGMGTHEKGTPESNAIVRMVFPYLDLIGGFAPLIGLSTLIIQIPIYGFVIGWAWSKGRFVVVATALAIAHMVAYFLGPWWFGQSY